MSSTVLFTQITMFSIVTSLKALPTSIMASLKSWLIKFMNGRSSNLTFGETVSTMNVSYDMLNLVFHKLCSSTRIFAHNSTKVTQEFLKLDITIY